jgi:hypothetical protein
MPYLAHDVPPFYKHLSTLVKLSRASRTPACQHLMQRPQIAFRFFYCMSSSYAVVSTTPLLHQESTAVTIGALLGTQTKCWSKCACAG